MCGVVVAHDDLKVVFPAEGQLAQRTVEVGTVAAVLLEKQAEEHRLLTREFDPLHPALLVGGEERLRDLHVAVKDGLCLQLYGGLEFFHVLEGGENGRGRGPEALADLAGGQGAFPLLAQQRERGGDNLLSGKFRFRGHRIFLSPMKTIAQMHFITLVTKRVV